MTVSTEQVRLDLPALLARLRSGETITIEENGEPVGTLSPVPSAGEGNRDAGSLAQPANQEAMAGKWTESGHEQPQYEMSLLPTSLAKSRLARLGFMVGKGHVPRNWKEIGRDEIERDFYGDE